MSYPYYHQVERAELELLAEGKIKQRTNQTDVENDKGLICRRAAYYVYTENNPSHGIMEKTEGNNSMGYSVDWILQQTNGEGWDITTDSDGMAGTVNGDSHGPNPDYIPRWRMPTKELAQIEEVPPEPEPDEDDELMDYLESMEARIITSGHENTDRIMNELHRIVEEAEETLKQVLVGYLVLRDNEEEPPAEDDSPRVLLLKLLQELRQPERSAKKGKK